MFWRPVKSNTLEPHKMFMHYLALSNIKHYQCINVQLITQDYLLEIWFVYYIEKYQYSAEDLKMRVVVYFLFFKNDKMVRFYFFLDKCCYLIT